MIKDDKPEETVPEFLDEASGPVGTALDPSTNKGTLIDPADLVPATLRLHLAVCRELLEQDYDADNARGALNPQGTLRPWGREHFDALWTVVTADAEAEAGAPLRRPWSSSLRPWRFW